MENDGESEENDGIIADDEEEETIEEACNKAVEEARTIFDTLKNVLAKRGPQSVEIDRNDVCGILIVVNNMDGASNALQLGVVTGPISVAIKEFIGECFKKHVQQPYIS